MATCPEAWQAAARASAEGLLAERAAQGIWRGHLTSSALSTAVAAGALARMDSAADLVAQAVEWLATHQNADGGWGDTADSPSNPATTLLCWAALAMTGGAAAHPATEQAAEACLRTQTGGALDAAAIVAMLDRRYGADRTFSAPILAFCAISGRLGAGAAAWRDVAQFPFEAAVLPHRLLQFVRLPVVSYALPALIAVGQARHAHAPSRCPVTRAVRSMLSGATLRKLTRIQPVSGGFLEAAPLTGFVTVCLASIGQADHLVARRGAAFLRTTVRADGSWPIDTDLAGWVTSLATLAVEDVLSADDRVRIRRWLLGAQHRQTHPYTQAAGGGWAWTDLSGGVPDVDDTSAALRALRRLADDDPAVPPAARQGVAWLLGLQNTDGGWPTFCRGWGKLPFDASCPDLTAHALAALAAWPTPTADRVVRRGVAYLRATQAADGAWRPLWFGNQQTPDESNPVYGTGRVLALLAEARPAGTEAMARAGVSFLLGAQQASGGWGGAADVPASVEETAIAVEALAAWRGALGDDLADPLRRGVEWLLTATAGGTQFPASPIGLYFARLWYAERLYPRIFAASAFRAAARVGAS